MAELSYLQAAGIAFNPFAVGFTTSDAMDTFINNPWYGIAGYVSPGVKSQLIVQEATNNVLASGGTLSMTDATAQASSDVTAVLTDANADPTQAPGWLQSLGEYAKWGIIILALILGIKVISIVK